VDSEIRLPWSERNAELAKPRLHPRHALLYAGPMGTRVKTRAATLLGLTLAMLGLCVQPCFAQITETSPGHFTCTAPAGHAISAELRPFAHPNAIGAQIRFVAPQRHLQYPPGVSLGFVLDDGRWAGIVVQSRPADARSLAVALKAPESPEAQYFAFLPSNRILTIATTLDEDGTLTARSGGQALQWRLGPVHMVRRIMQCQSGRFEIDVSASEAISGPH
jgi:hypothetical protein